MSTDRIVRLTRLRELIARIPAGFLTFNGDIEEHHSYGTAYSPLMQAARDPWFHAEGFRTDGSQVLYICFGDREEGFAAAQEFFSLTQDEMLGLFAPDVRDTKQTFLQHLGELIANA